MIIEFLLRLHARIVFYFPVLGHIMNWVCGAFPGNRELCDEAMEKEVALLVFPGGAKEVLRKKGYIKHSLDWGKRSGFARLAIKHGRSLN